MAVGQRSDQWACLAELLPWALTQSGVRIKVIRADGEWITPTPVVELEKEWGFEIKATNADTPQQDGLV